MGRLHLASHWSQRRCCPGQILQGPAPGNFSHCQRILKMDGHALCGCRAIGQTNQNLTDMAAPCPGYWCFFDWNPGARRRFVLLNLAWINYLSQRHFDSWKIHECCPGCQGWRDFGLRKAKSSTGFGGRPWSFAARIRTFVRRRCSSAESRRHWKAIRRQGHWAQNALDSLKTANWIYPGRQHYCWLCLLSEAATLKNCCSVGFHFVAKAHRRLQLIHYSLNSRRIVLPFGLVWLYMRSTSAHWQHYYNCFQDDYSL